MTEKIKGYLIDVNSRTVGKVEVERELSAYYELLGCDLIDIIPRKIGGKYYDIMLDDEGFFKEDPVISAMNEDGVPMVGSLLIMGMPDTEGNSTNLSGEDIAVIRSHVRGYINDDGFHPVLTDIEY